MRELDPAYISAFSALFGATIGGLASFGTSWTTQRTQLRHARRDAERSKIETLYNDFIAESSRLLGDALSHQKDDVTAIVGLYALVGRMRLVSPREVVTAADEVIHVIIETYLGPNRALHEMLAYAQQGNMNVLVVFGEACRSDLAKRA